MADKSVSIDLVIKSSEAASSLKEVKQSLKDIKDAMIGAGEGSAQFNKLAQAAAKLKDKVDDSNEAIAAMNPNKFQAVASFAASAAGGISAVTGAMGLFGEQSEEVTKTLAKVQSAMALSQGLASLSELPKAWNSIKTALGFTTAIQQTKNIVDAEAVVVTEAQVVATTELEVVQKRQSIGTRIATGLQYLWNTAIMANPIGAIVIAVAALVAGIYLLTKAFSSSNVEQERQIKLTKDMNEASVEGAKNSAVERNNLEILYKTSTDQTKSLQERKDAQVELQKTYPLTFKNYSDEDFALGKAKIGFDNLTDSVLALATMKAKQSVLDKMAMEKEEFMVTKTAELTQAISDQTNARTTWGKVAGYTREENIKEEIAAKEIEFNLNSKAIIAEVEGAKKKSKLAEDEKVASGIAAKDKTDAEAKAKADAEKNAAAYKARKEQEAKINEEFRTSQLSDEEKQLEDFTALQKVYLKNKNITQQEYDNRLYMFKNEILNKTITLELEQTELSLIAEMEATNAAIDNAQFEADEKIRIEKEKIAEEKAIRKKEFTDKLELALKLNEGLQSLSDMAFTIKMHNTKKGSAEEEKALRAQFKINKALQLSSVIIQGILAAQTAYAAGVAAGALTTGGVASLPMGSIYAGVSIAGTLAAVAKIAATQFDTTSVGSLNSGGGGGGGPTPDLNAGAATATSNSQPSTLLNPDGTVANNNNNAPTPIQVYVVESDITSTQQRVNVVQNQMSFQ